MRAAHTILSLLAIAVVSLFEVGASAQAQSGIQLDPSAPFEYWQDPCGYPDIIPSEYRMVGGSLQRLLSAEAILVPHNKIEQRIDDQTHYRLTDTSLHYDHINGYLLTAEAPFLGEVALAPNGRSGYLVAPNIVVTAAHYGGFNPAAYAVVFDARAHQDPVNPNLCIPFDPEHIPADNVFFPRSTAPLIVDTMSEYPNYGVDYAAFYLDRPATGRQYLRLRSTGAISTSDHIAMVSHPYQLATKLIYDVDYVGMKPLQANPSITAPIFTNFYLATGTSGGVFYNLDRNYAETSVGSVSGAGCMYIVPRHEDETAEVHDVCDDTPWVTPGNVALSYSEVNHGGTNMLSEFIPTPYLRVEPLADVTYILPLNGVASPSQTSYLVSASDHATGNTALSVIVAPTTAPHLVQIGAYPSTLPPGATTTVDATVSVPQGTPCGVYDKFVAIVDETNNFRDRMRHRFDIGMKAFDVAPATLADVYGVASPSAHSKKTFTLTNIRPTSVTVEVAVDVQWAEVQSLSSTNPATFTLAPMGSPNSSRQITVGLNAAAFSLANGDHQFNVTFSAQAPCVLGEPVSRGVVFHKGRVRVEKVIDALVPMPTPPGMPVESSIAVLEPFCISTAAVALDTGVVGSAFGATIQTWVPHLTLGLNRSGVAPVPSISLWDRTALPVEWFVPTTLDSALGMTIETLQFDSGSHAPPTGQTFEQQLGNRLAQGIWTLRMYDDGLQAVTRNEAYAMYWSLDIWGYAGSCPN